MQDADDRLIDKQQRINIAIFLHPISMSSTTHPAKQALVDFNKRYPELGKIIDHIAFSESSAGGTWPKEFLLPGEVWPAIFCHCEGVDPATLVMRKENISARVHEMEFLGTWGKTQGIYRFDPTVYHELVDSPLDGEIPTTLLSRLPEWCIYLETPGLKLFENTVVDGCWAMPTFTRQSTQSDQGIVNFEVLLNLRTTAGKQSFTSMQPLILELHTGVTLASALERYRNASIEQLGVQSLMLVDDTLACVRKTLSSIISLSLYVATQNDLRNQKGLAQPQRPAIQMTKGVQRMFAPSTANIWDVGVRMGSSIRQAVAAASNTARTSTPGVVIPHIRRPHWHGFRVGKIKDEAGNLIAAENRELVLKWLPSVAVNLPENKRLEDLPAVIRPVR